MARKPNNYTVYSKAEKRWLRGYAKRLKFIAGKRTPNGAWNDIAKDFRRVFARAVHPGRLAYQARRLLKEGA